jgi:hypothetical protein
MMRTNQSVATLAPEDQDTKSAARCHQGVPPGGVVSRNGSSSPCADSVAIIAASSHVDVPFVMAMQVARFMLVLLVGPTLAKAVARWTQS